MSHFQLFLTIAALFTVILTLFLTTVNVSLTILTLHFTMWLSYFTYFISQFYFEAETGFHCCKIICLKKKKKKVSEYILIWDLTRFPFTIIIITIKILYCFTHIRNYSVVFVCLFVCLLFLTQDTKWAWNCTGASSKTIPVCKHASSESMFLFDEKYLWVLNNSSDTYYYCSSRQDRKGGKEEGMAGEQREQERRRRGILCISMASDSVIFLWGFVLYWQLHLFKGPCSHCSSPSPIMIALFCALLWPSKEKNTY